MFEVLGVVTGEGGGVLVTIQWAVLARPGFIFDT